MLQIGQQIRTNVEKLVFQGKGLIRYEGWVIFVDDVAPSEEVVIQITAKKKSYFVGKLIEVVTPSPLRVVPLCPYFGTCGGCQLQHINYSAQIGVKQEWLQEALSHKVALSSQLTVLPAEKEWAYRRKVTLHFIWLEEEKRFQLGYYTKDNTTLLEIAVCPIFASLDDTIIVTARNFLSTLQGSVRMEGSLTILKMNGRYLLRFFFTPNLPKNAKSALHEAPQDIDIWMESPKVKMGIDKSEFLVDALGLKVYISPRVFLQNYPEQSLELYKKVMELVQEASSILDLYCGVGILTLLLAKEGRPVLGIESNKESIRLAKMSALVNGIESVRFMDEPVEKVLGPHLKTKKYQSWIVNPPREGMSKEMVALVLEFRPQQIVYVSCMPATLARDLALLQEVYLVDQGIAYDMFPQTTHLETVVSLRRKVTLSKSIENPIFRTKLEKKFTPYIEKKYKKPSL
ncbi:MAG: putative methyl transferase [Chlamydiia bacterium]|nr:putative methyl transferase [Chlamydiia bacterium]